MRYLYNESPFTRYFADIRESGGLVDKLAVSSRSFTDLDARINAYEKAFSNLDDLTGGTASTRVFNGTTGLHNLNGLQPIQFIDVTVAAMIKSIAGFLTIERGVDAPQVRLPFVDLVSAREKHDRESNAVNPYPAEGENFQGLSDMVSPNIGPDATWNEEEKTWNNGIKSAQNVATVTIDANGADSISYLSSGASVVPGSMKIRVTKVDGTEFVLTDDARGNVLAPAGTNVTSGSINYRTGLIKVALGDALVENDKYTIDVAFDTPRTPINRVKSDVRYYELTTYPQSILAESNSITNLVAQKSLGVDMNAVLKKKVMDEYIKMINKSVIDTLTGSYVGDTVTVDVSAYSLKYNDFNTYLQLFAHGMNQVNSVLTYKSWKSVNTSAYVVGMKVAELFRNMAALNTFVPNNEYGYIEDLIGYYNGVPVIQSYRLKVNEGYAIHKTSDGLMAPMARGIFLPVNDLPEVGNFNNPTQTASGIFSYEGVKFLTSDLVQRFELIFPAGMDTVAMGRNGALINGTKEFTQDSWGGLLNP